MGQILDRIFNLGKTYFNEAGNGSSFQNILNQEDEELKKIIDELNTKSDSTFNNKSTNNKSTNNQNSQRRYKTQDSNSENQKSKNTQSSQSRLPKEVVEAFEILELNKNSNIEQIGVDQIKRQYKKMIALNHPDRFQNKSESERKAYEVKASKINNAYNILKKHYNFN